ncbi:kinetochore protein SPC24 homolog [Mercurialis annua]|uniref:kinetochore protein SPC24 homolog n=1 Tax=Mercurialis annua TaxID=3986 RepID=UPI00215DD559|nr:kinetochore protein SPC24 homolog [Mercurialis annua]
MGDLPAYIDVTKLISFSDDLVAVLEEKTDINSLTQCLRHSKSLQSSGDHELDQSRSVLKDYEKKIEECKQKTEKAKLEVSSDEELELLYKELEEEREKEQLLMEELRGTVVEGSEFMTLAECCLALISRWDVGVYLLYVNTVTNNETAELERQRIFVKEQRKTVKKLEQEDLNAQRKLSMYASITNLLPVLDDPAKISFRIVDRDKKVAELFTFDETNTTPFDLCQSIWKTINLV